MGERFSGGDWSSWEAPKPVERTPEIVMQEHYDAIQLLLSKLIEGGGELSGQAKKALRQGIQGHLAQLGLTDITQLSQVAQHLHEVTVKPPTPPNYPSKEEFADRLQVVTNTLFEARPQTPRNPNVTDVATYGTTDWSKVPARSGNLVQDIYGLGKVMSSELAYRITFPSIDPIVVGDRMHIDNGRHRALTLRTLGPAFARQQGMNHYVDVKRNNGNY